eukprot:m.11504 g.11504  ORF g.11504 m.11504 type:complete len:429 (+) comp8836_c0_seq2:84-1370(+)
MWSLVSVATALVSITAATNHEGDFQLQTLVVMDPVLVVDQFSVFLGILKDQGHKLEYVSTLSPSLAVRDETQELLFQNLVVLSEDTEAFGGTLSAEELGAFIDQGGNVLLATSSHLGDVIIDFASETGFEFDQAGAHVLDHVGKIDGDPTLFKTNNSIKYAAIGGEHGAGRGVLFRGIGMSSDPQNEFVMDMLFASKTAYSYRPTDTVEDYPFGIGESTLLVGGLQARNNARVVVSGSLDLFGDDLMADTRGSNQDFVTALVGWGLGSSGRLSASQITVSPQGNHMVGDEMTICVEVTSANPTDSPKPFVTKEDIFIVLKKLQVITRHPVDLRGSSLCAQIEAPNEAGVYTISVLHRQRDYSLFTQQTQVTIRPRMMSEESSFYTFVFSSLVGTTIFYIVYISFAPPTPATTKYSKGVEREKENKKKK